jgi:glycosyltransferase involved in cell wall biosynthesis
MPDRIDTARRLSPASEFRCAPENLAFENENFDLCSSIVWFDAIPNAASYGRHDLPSPLLTMKILFLTYHFPTPHEPGAGRPWETAQMLRKLGHEPVVITAGTHYMTGEDIRAHKTFLSTEEIDGFRVVKTFAVAGYRRSIVRRLMNYISFVFFALIAGLREHGCRAILMATDPIVLGPVGMMLSALTRRPLILDERDLYPETAVALGYISSPLVVRTLDAWQNFVRRRAATILAATPGIKRLLTAKGIDADRIFVFPNVRHFTAATKSGHGTPFVPMSWRGKFVVLYIGKFGQANDMFTILRAAKQLADSLPDIRFAFIGEGERRVEYEQFLAREGLNNVELIGAVPWDAARNYVDAAQLGVQSFCNNSFWRCALSTKIFDYMLAGKPVVFAGEGDTADLIEAARAGIVVKPEDHRGLADAVAALYKDPVSRAIMGRSGSRYVSAHFSADSALHTLGCALRPVL